MRWPWRRAETPVPASEPAFDASIDVDLSHLAAEERSSAVAAIAAQVGALPGAGWVSVEPHLPPSGVEVRVYLPGSSRAEADEGWAGLRRRVEGVVREAVAGLSAGWGTPAAPVRTGFAEAMSLAQLDALAQLATLAGERVTPKPPPAPVTEADDDVDRLANLLSFVLPVDGRELAEAAVRRFGSYAGVLAAPEAELRRVAGLGAHSIAAIKLVHAASVRLARAGVAARPVLDDPKRLADYLAAALARERIEQFRILFLDEDGMLRADEVQASGTVNHTPVYPREVVRRALALGAASLVLVHNHPSGDPAPSTDDIEMTKQVRAAAEVMSIKVRDHLIVGNGRWLSFRESGLLD